MSDITLNKIHLQKDIYEAKQARDILDEEFTEFLPAQRNIGEFFDIYNKKFFSILNITHEFFIENSLNYIKEWTNPKTIVIKNIQEEIENVDYQLNSSEKFHPVFPNNIVLSPSNPQQYENISLITLLYMQSGKARFIQGENKESLFNMLKTKTRSSDVPNNRFIIQIYDSILDSLNIGKPIENENDLNDSFYILNTYNGGTYSELQDFLFPNLS